MCFARPTDGRRSMAEHFLFESKWTKIFFSSNKCILSNSFGNEEYEERLARDRWPNISFESKWTKISFFTWEEMVEPILNTKQTCWNIELFQINLNFLLFFANADDEKRRSIDGPTSHLNPNGLHSVSSHTRRDGQNYFTTK